MTTVFKSPMIIFMLARVGVRSNFGIMNIPLHFFQVFMFLLWSFAKHGNSFELTFVQPPNPEETGDYFEGDIIPNAPKPGDGLTRAGILRSDARWPKGEIPYEFEANYPHQMRYMVERAMDHINGQTRNCIKFVKRSSEKDYIEIKSSTKGCYSNVGRQPGGQTVSLPSACRVFGTAVHELIHAIGFFHEQSRTDRDDYVRVHWRNIKRGTEQNFDKYDSNMISGFKVPYDYGSVMHYSSTAFSKNGRAQTLEPIRRGVQIGQRKGMSPKDIQKIKNMYNCN